jgi:hypothetical protein
MVWVLATIAVLVAWVALRSYPGPYLRTITRRAGELYLRRWALRPHRPSGENGWRVYLHRFHAADDDGHHNHPWRWSFSIVLRGSYTEEVLEVGARPHWPFRLTARRVRWFNWISASKYHRITELHGDVWTLFFCGPVAQGWGFWIPGRGHVPFAERIAERDAEAPTLRSPAT